MAEHVLYQAASSRHAGQVPPASARSEIRAAIALVATGGAKTVRIANLSDAERAAEGLSVAQASRVSMRIVRETETPPPIVIGPRLHA